MDNCGVSILYTARLRRRIKDSDLAYVANRVLPDFIELCRNGPVRKGTSRRSGQIRYTVLDSTKACILIDYVKPSLS